MKTIYFFTPTRRIHLSLLVVMLAALLSVGCGALDAVVSTGEQTAEVDSEQPAQPVQSADGAALGPTPTAVPDELIAQVDSEEQIFINIYQRVSPAVVNIDISQQSGTSLSDLGSGSGFVIDSDGHIVTNQHVVSEADQIRVTFANGAIRPAKLVGTDPFADLAVIRVDELPEGVAPVEMGDSDHLLVGQRVIAIGNPFGLTGTMTIGIVSALGRTLPSSQANSSIGAFSNPEIIQTDAAINPGNSGGPLLDSRGRVIGVNTAIRSETGLNSGIGFAVPVNTVKRSVEQILESGEVSYAYLGISASTNFTVSEVAGVLGLSVTEGVLITDVAPGSAAARAGLRGGNRTIEIRSIPVTVGGDIITEIDGEPMHEFDDLLSYLVSHTRAGDRITLTIFRDGEFFDVEVVLDERPQ